MSLVQGTVTATADALGNVTLGGSDFALAIANALNPGIAPAQILAYKAALAATPAAFAALVTQLYATTPTRIASLTTYLNAALAGGGGSFTAGGDLGGTSTSQTVEGWYGHPLDASTMGAPGNAQIPIYVTGSTEWQAVSLSGDVTINAAGVATVAAGAKGITQLTGDVTAGPGSGSQAATVAKVNGASVPAAGGALTTGNVLQVSGASSLAYGAVNLAGGSNYVTGVLPTANQASQALGGDGSGTTAALSVIKWRGQALDAATMGAPTDAQIPIWVNGSSAWKAVSLSGDATTTDTGAVTVGRVNGATVPAAGALVTGALLQATGVSALSYTDPTLAPLTLPFVNLQSHQACWYLGGIAASLTLGQNEFGWVSLASAGNTITNIAPAAGSRLGGARRTRFASTGSTQLGIAEGGANFYMWRGDAAGRGGFKFACRFALIALGNLAAETFAIGVSSSNAPGFTDFTTDAVIKRVFLTQSFTATAGGAVPASTNWKVSECDGTTNHLTDTGLAVTLSHLMEFLLYCAPNGSITWTLNDLTAATTATGTASTNPPATTVFMMPAAHASTSITGTQFDLNLVYAEMFD